MAKTRRNYTGNAIATTTSASIAASGTTSFTVADATGWPYGSAPFYVVVEPGSSSEEKMLVTRAGSTDTTLSVYSTPSVGANRGLDGTSAVSHSSGSSVYPVFTAADADEANEMTSTLTAKGDLITHGTSTFAKLAVGTNNYVLVADSAQTVGIKWGQVQTAGIADDAVTAAKIASSAVGNTEIAAGSITADKFASGAVPDAVPTGVVSPYAGSSAPSGWLLCDGSTKSQSTYAALYAIIGATYNTGSEGAGNFRLPNMKGNIPAGLDTTQTEFNTLGKTGGAKTHTLLTAEMPVHTHTQDAHTHTQAAHTHTQSSHSHSGTTDTGAVSNTIRVVDLAGNQTAGNHATGYAASAYTELTAGATNFPGASHTHTFSTSSATPTINNATATNNNTTATNQNTGGGGAHNNLQPYIVLNYIIKT